MSVLPLKTIILGSPNSGKTTFLYNISPVFFTPIMKKKSMVEYLFMCNSFFDTKKETLIRIKEYIKKQKKLYMDEPFYLLLPFEDDLMFDILKGKNFVLATHRTAYFLLFEPQIIYLNENHESKNINILELGRLMSKPDFNFFINDIDFFSSFLNKFSDINIDKYVLEKIKKSSLSKNRTTYIVRDFILWYALNPGEFNKRYSQYKEIVHDFFALKSKSISKKNIELINKILEGFIKI